MSHQISTHERSGKGFQRQPSGFDGTGRQHHGAIRGNGNEILLSVVLEFDGIDHAVAVAKLNHVRAWDQKEFARGIWISRSLADSVNQNGRAAVLVERE